MIHIERTKHNTNLASKFNTNYQINQTMNKAMLQYGARNLFVNKLAASPPFVWYFIRKTNLSCSMRVTISLQHIFCVNIFLLLAEVTPQLKI